MLYMRAITSTQLNELLEQARVKPRLRREVCFGASVDDLTPEAWSEMELVRISDRSGNEGVLLAELAGMLFVLPHELSARLTDAATGRTKPIICDLCTTWQAGGNATAITFDNRETGHHNAFLVCADLKCSLHVRNQTSQALLSRSQLREDLTDEQRVERLRRRLLKLMDQLGLEPVMVIGVGH